MKNRVTKSTNGNGTQVLRRTGMAAKASAEPIVIGSQELIASRAYEIWQHRGRMHGFDQQDWFLAEQEFRQSLKV
jgi:hypothetical protein